MKIAIGASLFRADGTPTRGWRNRFCSFQPRNKTLSSSNQRFNRFCKKKLEYINKLNSKINFSHTQCIIQHAVKNYFWLSTHTHTHTHIRTHTLNSAITLYLEDMLGFCGDIRVQQNCLINYQRRMSKWFSKIRFYHSENVVLQKWAHPNCCKITTTKKLYKNVYRFKAIFDQQVSILNQNC